ncbi:MAG TPA: hypothetical protein VLA52_01960 [Thermohalobaculum sp.]|nr:hypothetical protein [Thermohalobaculum sp.]
MIVLRGSRPATSQPAGEIAATDCSAVTKGRGDFTEMAYFVGVAMVVAGLMLLEFGRRYHRSASAASLNPSFFAGEFMSLCITILLAGGMTTLIAEPLMRTDLTSALYFGLALASIAVIFTGYLKLTRAMRRVRPAAPIAHA